MQEEIIELHCPKCGANGFKIERDGGETKRISCLCGFKAEGADLEALIHKQAGDTAKATVAEEFHKIFSGLKGFKKL